MVEMETHTGCRVMEIVRVMFPFSYVFIDFVFFELIL